MNQLQKKIALNRRYIIFGSLVVLAILTSCLIIANRQTTSQPGSTPQLSHHEFMTQAATLTELANNQDPKAAFNYLQNNIQTNPALARDCHPLLHHLGHEAYKKYSNFGSAIEYQNELCNSGYTHGLIESHFANAADINKALKETCQGQEGNVYLKWQCTHGIGHGVMYFTNKDVPASIALCRTLDTAESTDSCINGVFMERFIAIDHSGMQTSKLPMDLGVCAVQEENIKADCYLYAPSAYLSLNPNKYHDALNFCKDAGEHEPDCVRGVGMQTMKENITDPDIAKSVCYKAKKTLQSLCVNGAVGLYIFHQGSTTAADTLCEKVFKRYQNSCKREVEYQKNYFSI